MDLVTNARIAEMVSAWAIRAAASAHSGRSFVKLMFGTLELVEAVRTRLESLSDEQRAFLVRRSGDDDAVRVRNQPRSFAPQAASSFYLVFWLPGTIGHERNARSLSDLRSVDVSEVLADSIGLVFSGETKVEERCIDAASSESDERERGRLQTELLAGWGAVRRCLREGRGGRSESVPFVSDLGAYLAYLDAARIDDTEWAAIAPSERATKLARRWGQSFPLVSLFSLPALPELLGMRLDARSAVKKKPKYARWSDQLAGVLSENLENALDFSALADLIAGKDTLAARLDSLRRSPKIVLHRDDPAAAWDALARFCHDGSIDALRKIEWLFHDEHATGKRSVSLGLKGLLIARNARAPRENPLDTAVRETLDAFRRNIGDDQDEGIRSWVQQRRSDVERDSRRAENAASVLRELGRGVVPSGTDLDVGSMQQMIAKADFFAAAFDKAARRWERLAAADDDDRVRSRSVLLGLVRLCHRALDRKAIERGGLKRLALVFEGSTRVEHVMLPSSVDANALDQLRRWLVTDVRDAWAPVADGEDGDLFEGDEDEVEEIELRVLAKGSGEPVPLGSIALEWSSGATKLAQQTRGDVLRHWRLSESELPSGRRAWAAVFDRGTARAAAPRELDLGGAWTDYIRAVPNEAGGEILDAASPVSKDARRWVDVWSSAIARARSSGATENFDELLSDALERGDLEEARNIMQRQKSAPPASTISIDATRELLDGCTGVVVDGNDRTIRLVFTPHHPLVLRMRAIADDVLAAILQTLCTTGWPETALSELETALARWGLPEPVRVYGFWAGEPLVFESWDSARGVALFGIHAASRHSEDTDLGVREVAGVLSEYAELHPAAADRLRLRIRGDRDGRWAWSILRSRIDDGDFSADVDVLGVDLPGGPRLVERFAGTDERWLRAFELRDDGGPPDVRVRTRTGNDEAVHLALALGDTVAELRPAIEPVAPSGASATTDRWDPRILFHRPIPDVLDYSFTVGERPDALSRDVAAVVATACGKRGMELHERYSFDPTRVAPVLRRLHEGAHWLVLVSRQPLYRAVQACEREVATLLDFYSDSDRGRAVHVCVSLGAANAKRELSQLDAALRALVRDDGEHHGARLVDAARRLAPGLAMRCAGAAGASELGGLLGLLLSSHALAAETNDSLVLALDQHRDLLPTAGRRGDLLSIAIQGRTVRIGIGEAKFTTLLADGAGQVVAHARGQIQATRDALAHLETDHPLLARSRMRLMQAVVHRAHLGGLDASGADRARQILAALDDPKTCVAVGPPDANHVFVWSVAEGTKTASTTDGGIAVRVFSRAETLARLSAIGE